MFYSNAISLLFFSSSGGGTCAKIPAQPDISFSRPGTTVFFTKKCSVSVCFNARIFVFYLSLFSKLSSWLLTKSVAIFLEFDFIYSAENAHLPHVVKFNIFNLCITTSLVRNYEYNFSLSEDINNVFQLVLQ